MTLVTKLILTAIIKYTISIVRTNSINWSHSISRIFPKDGLLGCVNVSLGVSSRGLSKGVIHLLLPCVRGLLYEVQSANTYWACITFKVF